jgi:hypothetical protein
MISRSSGAAASRPPITITATRTKRMRFCMPKDSPAPVAGMPARGNNCTGLNFLHPVGQAWRMAAAITPVPN